MWLYARKIYRTSLDGSCGRPLNFRCVAETAIRNVGALIIRIGFWGHYTMITLRSPQSSIGSYLGPYISGSIFRWCFWQSDLKGSKEALHSRGTLLGPLAI